MRSLVALLAAVAVPVAAQPPAPAPGPAPLPAARTAPAPRLFTPFGEAYVGFGGDAVAELVYENGETRPVNAGQGGALALGVRVRPAAAVPVSAVASLGYKVVFEPSDNANVRLSRFPITLGLRGEGGPGLWAEASAVRHLSTTLHGDGFFPDEDFDSSVGAALAAGWKWVGLHYTTVRYTAEADGTEFDASTVAVTLRVSPGSGW